MCKPRRSLFVLAIHTRSDSVTISAIEYHILVVHGQVIWHLVDYCGVKLYDLGPTPYGKFVSSKHRYLTCELTVPVYDDYASVQLGSVGQNIKNCI